MDETTRSITDSQSSPACARATSDLGRVRGSASVLVALIVTLLVGCSDSPVSAPPITFPETGVSFNSHVKPLFLYNCAVSGCHDGPRSDNGNIGLETYTQVLSSGVVSTTIPERSRLAQVLRGELLHPRDPLFLALTTAQREGVIQWIREGALNN